MVAMDGSLDYPNPVKYSLKRFFQVPYLQLSAGPTNVGADVIAAMSVQPLTTINDVVYQMMDDIKDMLKYVYQTSNPLTLVPQCSGNGGNEIMIANLTDPGETILIAIGGVWGHKMVDMASRYNLNIVVLTTGPGEVYSLEELETAIIKHKPVVLYITHGESSGGTLQPLEGLGDICHKHNCLLGVDAVVSIGVSPIYVDRWGIDAISGGSQKGIGAPAGMCLMTFSSRAYSKMLTKKQKPPYILDILPLADVWQCFDAPRTYHYTYNSNMLAAVRQALIHNCEEGLENLWHRHKTCGELLTQKLQTKLGMNHFVKKVENRFCGVTCAYIPENVKYPALMKYILEKHHVELSFGIGPTANVALRFGLLGQNATPEVVDYLIEVLKDGINYCLTHKPEGPDSRAETAELKLNHLNVKLNN